jgi:hypothetical protein
MIFGYLIRSWEIYRENIMSFVIAELLSSIITGIIALIGIGIIFNSIGISNLINLSNPELMITKIVSILSLLLELGIASIFFIVAGIVWVFLKTGLYGMAVESLRGLTKFRTMFDVAKKSGFKGITSSIVLGVITFILFMILIIGLNIVLPIIGGIIGMILFFLITITFSLVFPGLVVDDLSPVQAIKESFNIAKKNYLEILGLLLLYTVISLVAIISLIGIPIYFFVVAPMMKISLVFFYKRKKV